MINQKDLNGTPMYEALVELAEKMNKEQVPPVELNVIGGFALMLHGMRPAYGVTDIDYVGGDLSSELNRIIEEVGRTHQMEPGWINKDGMAAGIGMEDFELSTGVLHFIPALKIGNIQINVLDEKDLLRLKIIAVDTAMTELEATGEFARIKDFHDINTLMNAMEMSPEDVIREFGEYMICFPDTGDLIHAIAHEGPTGGIEIIRNKKKEFEDMLNGTYAPGPFGDFSLDALDALLDQMSGKGV